MKMQLKTKITVGALSMLVIAMVLSMGVVSVIIRKQNREASHDILKKSLNIIVEDILERKEEFLSYSRQMATANDIGSNIRYIGESKSETELSIIKLAYENISVGIYKIALNAHVWKATVYDATGELASFFIAEEDNINLGYLHIIPHVIYEIATLRRNEKLTEESWHSQNSFPKINRMLGKEIPEQENTYFKVIDNFLCLVAEIPIMGEIYNIDTGMMEARQFGILNAIMRLDKFFIEKMSELTGTHINIFTKQGLSIGNLTDYNRFDLSIFGQSKKEWQIDNQNILLNDITLSDTGYFQAILAVYADTVPIAAIVSLYSKNIAKNNTWQMIKLLSLISIGFVLLFIPITFWFAHSLSKQIGTIAKKLAKISGQVASVSDEISTASQQLAKNSLKQVDGMEKTTSNLKTISDRVRLNADHANNADTLREKAKSALISVNSTMKETTDAMQNIRSSGEEIGKIIMTIDEVAFQTNLLALNAAIEASRAGNAGAGFAVVADEVRNLAKRSAQAAKDTQILIEKTVSNINVGFELVEKTYDSFQTIVEHNRQVGALIKKIAAILNEQTESIEQIAGAVEETDSVTQKNTASAQESSSTALIMNDHADQMKQIVYELVTVLGIDAEE